MKRKFILALSALLAVLCVGAAALYAEVRTGLETVDDMYGLDYAPAEAQLALETGEVLELVYDAPVQIIWETEGLGAPMTSTFTVLRLILDGGRSPLGPGMVLRGDKNPIPIGSFTITDTLRSLLAPLHPAV